jgi:hypothetical protein
MKYANEWRTVLALLGAFVLVASCATPKDDTDPPHSRSGLALHTDHLTGCQYLAKPLGGITPRVDGKGRHLGCKDAGNG